MPWQITGGPWAPSGDSRAFRKPLLQIQRDGARPSSAAVWRACPPPKPTRPPKMQARLLLNRLLHLQQRLLPFQSPAIAAHGPVFAHDTMTGNRHGNAVCGAGASYGAGGARLSDRLRDLAVGARRTERNRLQIGPHAPLECSGTNVQR